MTELLELYTSDPEAWQSVMTSDPLADSDEEMLDEHVRLDCCKHRTLLLKF